MNEPRGDPLKLEQGQFFGDCLRQLTIGRNVIRDTRLAPNARLPMHVHERAYVCVVMQGSYAEEAHRAQHCEEGSVVLHADGHAHRNQTGPQGARCVNLELDASLFGEGPTGAALHRERTVRLAPAHPALRSLRRALQRQDSAAGLSALGASLELLSAVLREPTAPQRRAPWLGLLVDYLESGPPGSPTAEDIARVTGVHASHAMRAFKQQTGESVGAFLRRRRLENADEALRCGAAPLAEIAAEAGFFDQAHFTRAYRQLFGATPGQRRRQHRR